MCFACAGNVESEDPANRAADSETCRCLRLFKNPTDGSALFPSVSLKAEVICSSARFSGPRVQANPTAAMSRQCDGEANLIVDLTPIGLHQKTKVLRVSHSIMQHNDEECNRKDYASLKLHIDLHLDATQ